MVLNTRQQKVVDANDPNILCIAGGGAGKCQPNSLIIPTPQGPRKIGDIKVGDFIFDRYGKPTKVLQIFPQGKKDVYEIVFGDGRKTQCCNEHIWNVHKETWRKKEQFKNMTLQEIIEDGYKKQGKNKNKYYYKVPCLLNPVEYIQQETTIDPYLFGVFLGDGCCKEEHLTLSSNDKEIVDSIIQILGKGQAIKQSDKNFNWNFYEDYSIGKHFLTKNIFSNYKEYICCDTKNKSIPDCFKYSTIENRYALLQGLMDTDGCITYSDGRYQVSFTTISDKLKDDFIELVGSLGYVCYVRKDERSEKYRSGYAYEIHINCSNSEKHKFFRLKRKQMLALSAIDKKQHRDYDRVSIRDIKKLNYQEEMTCFLVDNEEHLYLTNDFIITHNTRVLTERVKRLLNEGVPAGAMVAITFTNMAADEMKKRLGGICEGMFIGTVHSYANAICIANGIDTRKFLADLAFDKILKKAATIPKSKYPFIKYLFVDEFQDTSEDDYRVFERINAENIFYVGDYRQLIYGFRGSDEKFFRNIYEDYDFKKYYLTENYRCAPNILEFANELINSMQKFGPECEAVKEKDGIVEETTFLDALEEMEWAQDWGNWAILCRTNNELATAQEMLDKRNIPNVTFKKGDLDLVELEAIQSDNRVKVLTIHSAKGLEFKHVIVVGARMWSEEERRIAYVGATRAENDLYWCPSIIPRRQRAKTRDNADAGNLIRKEVMKGIVSF